MNETETNLSPYLEVVDEHARDTTDVQITDLPPEPRAAFRGNRGRGVNRWKNLTKKINRYNRGLDV